MKKNLFLLCSFNQKQLFRKLFFIRSSAFLIMLFFSSEGFAQHTLIDSLGEDYFFHVNDYPNNSPFWGDDDALTDGIAHDNKYWYIAVLGTNRIGRPNDDWAIRKIPVSRDLMADYSSADNTVRRSDVPVLDRLGYNHLGDLDHFNYGGKDYLIVPLEAVGSKHLPAAIAIFRCSDLSFIDYAAVPHIKDGIGWCAISHSDGSLYTSNDDADSIFKYSINWNQLTTHRLKVKFLDKFCLKGMGGSKIHDMQGGEFTVTDNLLYINSGIISCFCEHKIYANDGIHVFDTKSWQEVQHSTSDVTVTDYDCVSGVIRKAETGCFDYTFDNSGCSGEEPEGLTIWDMDKVPGHDPHINGQLHVLSYNHNTSVFHENEVKLKHYKRFKFPADITVYGTSASDGEPATNPAITKLLDRGTTFGDCAEVLYNHPPAIFPPGKTPVIFTVTDHKTVKVQDTAYVTVMNRHDECSTALTLNKSDSVIADNFCATTSEDIPAMKNYQGVIKDVWFKIYPSSPFLSVETFQIPGGLTNTVMQAFSGSCGNLNEIASNNNSGSGYQSKIILTNLPDLNPIYIRVTDFGGNEYGKFGICYKKLDPCEAVPQRHDECSTALLLHESDSVITDNFCATTSNGIPPIPGYFGVIKDVWFKIYPSFSSLSVQTFQIADGITNTVMQAFSGTCDNLHEIGYDNNSGSGYQSKITLHNLTDSIPVYIRITDFGGNDYGKFGIVYKKLATPINLITQQQTDSFKIYPNPTSGLTTIVAQSIGEFQISVYDFAHSLILPKTRFTGSKQLDLKSFANGVYFVDIYNTTTGERVVKRIMKMR